MTEHRKDDGGLAETERMHSLACRKQEAQRQREAEILQAGFDLGADKLAAAESALRDLQEGIGLIEIEIRSAAKYAPRKRTAQEYIGWADRLARLGSPSVQFGADGRCLCSCADRCPLGKAGMEMRCTQAEVDAYLGSPSIVTPGSEDEQKEDDQSRMDTMGGSTDSPTAPTN